MIDSLSLPAQSARFSLRNWTFWSQIVAWGLVILFSLTFSWLAIQRHHAFSSGFDLGVYNQVVWNTLHGRIFFYTSTGEPLLHLSNHADPILLLLAPLYLIYSGPETLLVLQAGLIGLAGLPIFWLGREKLKSDLAALSLLAAYLLFPGIEAVTLSDFHPPAIAFSFLVFAFYFLEKRKTGPFILFIVLAMACKEQIPLQVIFLGLYALIWQRNWRLGLTTICLGATWFVVVMYWVIPAYSVIGDHLFLDFYADFGATPLEIVTTVLTRPDLVLKNVWQPAKLNYLRDLLAPFAFLPLFGLPILLVGTPSFAINLLSANPALHNASRGHYVADVTPWLVFSTLFGMVYLCRWTAKIWPQTHLPRLITRQILSLGLLGGALSWHLFYGFSPLAANSPHWDVTGHDVLGQQLLSQIPADAPITAQLRLYAHVSHREIAYVFPHIFEANYIFLDVTADTSPLHPNDQRREIETLLQSGQFGVRDAVDGYMLLERGLDKPDLPPAFYDFARPAEFDPHYPVTLTFGDDLQLLGFDLLDDPRQAETVVRFYWRALQPIERNLRLYPFFINRQGMIIEDTELRPMITQLWYPPQAWEPGEIVVSQTLPRALGSEWSLAVGVLAGEDESWADWKQRLKVQAGDTAGDVRLFETNTWARLATFQRQGGGLTSVMASDQEAGITDVADDLNNLDVNLDNKMRLLGYEVNQAGQDLAVTLHWETLTKMGYDYTIFIHLVDAAGNPVAQHDAQPGGDIPIPTTTWQPGERLSDPHRFTLPADLTPGTYQLRVGVYYWQTLERLPVIENGTPVNNFVDLGPVEIGVR